MKVRFGTADFGKIERNAIRDLVNEKDPQLTMGKYVYEFERKVAQWAGVRYAVMTNSGTSALMTALSAYKQTVKRTTDYIVAPALTYCATWNSVRGAGLDLGIKDVEDDFVMHPYQQEILEGISTTPKLAVDLFGKPCRVDSVVEDATEAMGGMVGGVKLGTLGLMGCYSFHVTHVINTIEGGMVITDNENLYNACRQIRDNGKICTCPVCSLKTVGKCVKNRGEMKFERRFETHYDGFGFKPIEMQGLLGCLKMNRIEEITKRRHKIFKMYEEEFGKLGLVELPDEYIVSIAYPLKTKNPMKLVGELERVGIEARGMFPAFDSAYSVANMLSETSVLLPLHQGMSDDDVEFVIYETKRLIE
jgi:CDP-4-dehydro-6-deoxyglucose reductase, E1